jgi:hypothetical protein
MLNTTRLRAAAPVKTFTAVESAPPDLVELPVGVEVAVEFVEAEGEVAVAVASEAVAEGVSVTPTLLQIA